MRLIGVLTVLVGCQTNIGTSTPDAAMPTDGRPPQTLGMFVAWAADPALPGPVTDKITVSSATFQIAHLQLVGDAGNDQRTTRSRYNVTWDASGAPAQDAFPDAPVGVYSKISLDISSPAFTVEIDGTFGNEDSLTPFRVVDRMGFTFSLDCNETLPIGGSATISIGIAFQDALNNIDFKNIKPDQQGVIQATSMQQLAGFHSKMQKGAFTIN